VADAEVADAEVTDEKRSGAPAGAPSVGVAPVAGQLWAKRLPHGRSAALLINHSPERLVYNLTLAKLNLTSGARYAVRDLWAHADGPVVDDRLELRVPPWDSAFVTLTPS